MWKKYQNNVGFKLDLLQKLLLKLPTFIRIHFMAFFECQFYIFFLMLGNPNFKHQKQGCEFLLWFVQVFLLRPFLQCMCIYSEPHLCQPRMEKKTNTHTHTFCLVLNKKTYTVINPILPIRLIEMNEMIYYKAIFHT